MKEVKNRRKQAYNDIHDYTFPSVRELKSKEAREVNELRDAILREAKKMQAELNTEIFQNEINELGLQRPMTRGRRARITNGAYTLSRPLCESDHEEKDKGAKASKKAGKEASKLNPTNASAKNKPDATNNPDKHTGLTSDSDSDSDANADPIEILRFRLR